MVNQNQETREMHIARKRNILVFSASIIECILIAIFGIIFLPIITYFIPAWYLIIPLISYVIYRLFQINKTYFIESITQEKYKEIRDRKLIHYTNKITDKDYQSYLETGLIKLTGSNRAASNYVMRFKDKKQKFVWFHLEDRQNTHEPEFLSFIFSHGHESTKRKYKVIVDPKEIDINRIFFRRDNGNIIVKDDLEIPAKIETVFRWYDDKLYIKHLIAGVILTPFRVYTYCYSFHQLIGKVIDLMLESRDLIYRRRLR
ncbi:MULTISPECIES: hypothetical protein [Metabacillus]|uniref:hypothetical protein n=1 Tax=Metabacillus TaxID=2675233 RepID=UPI000C7F83CC|nr:MULTISPECIES: hypothetical protein [Metabacillus]MCM3443970.1 hypothetical protein [Metabacillus halosaccharovorans]PMC34976.1 hypothetical protein CJ195_20940 [Bacillus sp. UMB0899]